jgi:DNA-binding MarR family transcriptional regulator
VAKLLERLHFGRLLRQPPENLGVDEIAQALRIPVTTLGETLRRQSGKLTLSSSHARVLSQLSAGDSLTISNLSQSQQLAMSSMAEVVAKLAAAGLVTKTASSDDRREVRVSITKQGQRHLAAALEARTELLARRLTELSEQDRLSIAAALPALWRLSELDPEIWPRIADRPPT